MPESHFTNPDSRPQALRKEQESRQSKASALLKYYHQRLLEEGRPEDYVLSRADFQAALGIEESEISNRLLRAFGTQNQKEVLHGLGLPFEKKPTITETKFFSKTDIISWLDKYILATKEQPKLQREIKEAIAKNELPPLKEIIKITGDSMAQLCKDRFAYWDVRNFKK
jgi:hypothetical protein